MSPENFKPEISKEEIISHNEHMLERDMRKLLNKESVGGNAGGSEIDGKVYPCAAANGLIHKETGELVAFGNPQDWAIRELPPNVRESCTEITFRVAFSLTQGFFKIVDILYEDTVGEAQLALVQEAVDAYNARRNPGTGNSS